MSVDRTTWPPAVPCLRSPLSPYSGYCMGHADCRAGHWQRVDIESLAGAIRAKERGTPVPPKSRKKVA